MGFLKFLGALSPAHINFFTMTSGGEKVGTVLPLLLLGADHAQPGFVNEGGGLQGVAGGFTRHLVRRQPA